MTRIVIEEPCVDRDRFGCCEDGWHRRVLDPGSFVLIEKEDGEWPEWALHAAKPFYTFVAEDGYHGLATRSESDILDALAGGEQP